MVIGALQTAIAEDKANNDANALTIEVGYIKRADLRTRLGVIAKNVTNADFDSILQLLDTAANDLSAAQVALGVCTRNNAVATLDLKFATIDFNNNDLNDALINAYAGFNELSYNANQQLTILDYTVFAGNAMMDADLIIARYEK